MYVNGNQKLKAKPFWTTQPYRAEQYTNRDQQSRNIYGTNVCHQRGVTVHQQQSKPKTKTLLDDVAVSTSAVYHPRSAEPRHIWCRCMSPARYSCISTTSKSKAKALLDDMAMSTRAVSTAISKAKTYLAQVYINHDQQS